MADEFAVARKYWLTKGEVTLICNALRDATAEERSSITKLAQMRQRVGYTPELCKTIDDFMAESRKRVTPSVQLILNLCRAYAEANDEFPLDWDISPLREEFDT